MPEQNKKPEKKAPDKRKPEDMSIDTAVCEVLGYCEGVVETAFDRAARIKPCPIGADGACCKHCFMGPCRLVAKTTEGICGATRSTVAARNFARSVAAGAAAHSDHGRGMAFALLRVANGEAEGFRIRDEAKLHAVAGYLGIESEGRPVLEVARDVAETALAEFGKQEGELLYAKRATPARQKIWREEGIFPRGIDREVVEIMHRTHMGVDQDAENILDQTLRAALTDGWGGSMLATDISDILFGTPTPLQSAVNLGVLKDDEVNLIVHGHEPTLSEMIVAASTDPELLEYAKSKGASGINLAGICCTANEVLMRHGIPPAGNFLSQELAIATGAVEAMVVDVQCIMQALADVASKYHTKLITTSPKAKIEGATHMEFDEHHPYESAKSIVRAAIDNYVNRGESIMIPATDEALIAGFSHEYVRYMQGGLYRGSFRPLNDAVAAGTDPGAGRRRGLQQRSRAPGRPHRPDRPGVHPQRRPGGGDGLRGHGCGQVRLSAPRVHGRGGRRTARGLRGHRHPAGGARGLLRGQLPHPHHPHRMRDGRRSGRRHLGPAGDRHLPRVHVGEGHLHRLVLRGFGRVRDLRPAPARWRTVPRSWR